MSRFTDGMARANQVAGEIFGEPFTVGGVSYMALDIGDAVASERLVVGGLFKPGTIKITVTQATLTATGLTLHKQLRARGGDYRLDSITDEGDGCPVLVCGPAGAAPSLR